MTTTILKGRTVKRPTMTFKAIEDNAGGLHLFLFGDGKCVYAGNGFEQSVGSLFEVVWVLRNGTEGVDLMGDEDPVKTWSEMEAFMEAHKYGYKIIADTNGTYPDRMGVAASLDWEKQAAGESARVQQPKPNLLAVAIVAPTIDEAIKPIQDALGIVSGDVAAQYFHGYDQEEWACMRRMDRVLLIAGWLKDEVWSASP